MREDTILCYHWYLTYKPVRRVVDDEDEVQFLAEEFPELIYFFE